MLRLKRNLRMLVIREASVEKLKALHRDLIELQVPMTMEHVIDIEGIARLADVRPPIYSTEAILAEMVTERMCGHGMTFNPTSLISTDRRRLSEEESKLSSGKCVKMLRQKFGLLSPGRETYVKALPMSTCTEVIFTLRALFAVYCIRSGHNYIPPEEKLAN